jgi:hypothetical protein
MRCTAVVAIVAGCGSSPRPATPEPGTAAGPAAVADPDQAPAAPAADLAGDHACGPFSSAAFAATDVALLGDRLRVRFLPHPTVEGDNDSVRASVEAGGTTAFVGAREVYMRGDAAFLHHATKRASFDGTYDPVTLTGRGGIPIVTGLLKSPPDNSDLVAVAHGWFLDANHHVLDIAVFVTDVTAANLGECRRFAEKVIATTTVGSRALTGGTGATVQTKVSYATFEYVLPADWVLSSHHGIHDFARMAFRRIGVYPDGYTELQIGLDSHPGDWASPGEPDGTRAGMLFGLPVTWNRTKQDGIAGAWTISASVANRDHAVASITSGTAADRDEAIRFAESIKKK